MAVTMKATYNVAGTQNHQYDCMGLSTDTKPTEKIGLNSLFLELDTGDLYYFNGTTWAKVGGSNA